MQRARLQHTGLALSIVTLALIGYIGYLLYPRFELANSASVGLFILAPAAGVASFFSPCSFPLLVTLLASDSGYRPSTPQRRRSQLVKYASALAVGACVFLLLIGLGIALGASAVIESVTFTSVAGRVIRAVVGVFLILFGLIQFGILPAWAFPSAYGMSAFIRRGQRRIRRAHTTIGFSVFGFSYVLAGFG